MKKVAFYGTSGGVSFAQNGFDEGLKTIGMNTGNAIFQHALWSKIRDPKSVANFGMSPEFIRDHFDLLVIPAANQVNPQWDLGGWADFIEKANLPCVVIGLGAQAKLDDGTKMDLPEGTERFIKVLSERTTEIGVRGQFTQEVLANYGVTNTVITGCPSQTINMSVTGDHIQSKISTLKDMGVSRAAYLVGTLEDHARPTEVRVSSIAAQVDHLTVFQTDPRFLRFIHDGTLSEEQISFFKWSKAFLRPSQSYGEFVQYLRDSGIFYSDAKQWIDSMKRVDVALGMRIHGAVAAIQAGSLGVCVTFDSRTLELSETMGIPHISPKEISKCFSMRDVLDATNFSARGFEEKRTLLVGRIEKILNDSGIEISRR